MGRAIALTLAGRARSSPSRRRAGGLPDRTRSVCDHGPDLQHLRRDRAARPTVAGTSLVKGYIDAFAGTGYRSETGSDMSLFAQEDATESEELLKGSARLALDRRCQRSHSHALPKELVRSSRRSVPRPLRNPGQMEKAGLSTDTPIHTFDGQGSRVARRARRSARFVST